MIEPRIVEARQSAGRWRSLTLGSLLAMGCLLAASASASAAVILPAATSNLLCQAPFQTDVSSTSSCSQISANGHGKGSIVLTPFVDVNVHVDNLAGTGGFSVFSNLKYSFEVIGGQVGDIVPLLIETTISTSATNATHASATVGIGVTTSQGSIGDTFCASALCSAADFSGTLSILAKSGSVGTLGLNANVGGGFGATTSSATASADPFIFVDPSFANADLYSIVVSDGVANALPTVSTVPEPSSVLLLMVGLAGLAGLRRGMGQRFRLSAAISAGAIQV